MASSEGRWIDQPIECVLYSFWWRLPSPSLSLSHTLYELLAYHLNCILKCGAFWWKQFPNFKSSRILNKSHICMRSEHFPQNIIASNGMLSKYELSMLTVKCTLPSRNYMRFVAHVMVKMGIEPNISSL